MLTFLLRRWLQLKGYSVCVVERRAVEGRSQVRALTSECVTATAECTQDLLKGPCETDMVQSLCAATYGSDCKKFAC